MFRCLMPASFTEPSTAEDWIAELERYAQVVGKVRLACARLMRATLDGAALQPSCV